MLEHFKAIEDYEGPHPSGREIIVLPNLSMFDIMKKLYSCDCKMHLDKFHNKGGPLKISKPNYAPSLEPWVEAAKELGYPTNIDFNAYQTESEYITYNTSYIIDLCNL